MIKKIISYRRKNNEREKLPEDMLELPMSVVDVRAEEITNQRTK